MTYYATLRHASGMHAVALQHQHSTTDPARVPATHAYSALKVGVGAVAAARFSQGSGTVDSAA